MTLSLAPSFKPSTLSASLDDAEMYICVGASAREPPRKALASLGGA
jgi:hypothetical protein